MAFDYLILSTWIVRITGFIVILVLSIVIGRVAGRLLERLLHEFELNRFVRKRWKRLQLEEIIGMLLRISVYIAGLIIALNYIGFGDELYKFLAIIIGILIGIFLLLIIKDFVPNAIVGIFNKRKVGEEINIAGVNGRIIRISLTGVRLRTEENDIIEVPFLALRKI